jgi:hypothetical protein
MSTELTKSRVHLKHDLAAFLQQLPKWQDLASRQLFVQWALLNHPHAGVYQLMGQNPAADAQALVLATLGPGATDAGLDAARQLLQQVLAEPVGKATKAEAKRLLKEAGRIQSFYQIPQSPLALSCRVIGEESK